MSWTITMHELDGSKTYDIPFECRQVVYYAHKKKWWKRKSEWVVSVCVVTGMWVTGVYGVILDDNEYIPFCDFDQLFTDKEEAIEFCLKQNTYAKVKVYGG